LIGSNWILGWSHTSGAADSFIKEIHSREEHYVPLFSAFADAGIDAIMGLFSPLPEACDKIRRFEDATGKKLIILDTPFINTDDNENARREAEKAVRKSASIGAVFCMPHFTCVDKLVNAEKQRIDRLPDYLDMIRQNNLVPGLSTHKPEVIQLTDRNNYDVETYVQIFNCIGFMMHRELENVIKIIHGAKKPVMTIKPMAAGRVSPYVGLTFNWTVLRPQDLITVGCMNKYEAEEDIEISCAAFEKRLPDLKEF
jgi:hypothetical protein